MAIQLDSESLLTLQAAASWLPGRPHLSTLHRWRLRGVRGVKLDTCLIGGVRYTSKEAVQDFVASTTRQGDPGASSLVWHSNDQAHGNVRSSRSASTRAAKVLDSAGI